MGNTNGGKYKRCLYNLNLVRKKSNKKQKKIYESFIDILKKQQKGRNEKWVAHAKYKIELRCKKMGITKNAIRTYIQKKGLYDLLPMLADK